MQDVPAPIVAKAEMDSRIGAACARLAKNALVAQQHGAQGDLARIEIARQVCALALDPHARQEAKDREAKRRLEPGYVGGRPYTVHGLAFRQIESQTKLPGRTFRGWLKMWNTVARALGIEPDSEEGVCLSKETVESLYKGVNGNVAANPLETWLDDVLHPEEEKKEPVSVDPKQVITKAANTIQKLFNNRIPTKAELETLAESLNAALALSSKSSLPLYVARGDKAKAMHKTGAKSPFRKE